jgi:hypothetical protein
LVNIDDCQNRKKDNFTSNVRENFPVNVGRKKETLVKFANGILMGSLHLLIIIEVSTNFSISSFLMAGDFEYDGSKRSQRKRFC